MLKEHLFVNGEKHLINISFEKRKTITCTIKDEIQIKMPTRLSQKEKTKQLLKMKKWISKKLQEKPLKNKKIYLSGDKIVLPNKIYEIVVFEKNNKACNGVLKNNQIFLTISSNLCFQKKQTQISKIINALLAKEQTPQLKKKIYALNKKYFQEKINKISFKNQKSRWGSCSTKKNINISTKLLLAPDDVLDYVCVHELAHLKEPNHSKAFWQVVEKVMPDYKDKKEWLKKNGYKLNL